MKSRNTFRAGLIAAFAALIAASTLAQSPLPQQDPQAGTAGTSGRPSMRLLFAQSLAAAAQSMGTSLIAGLSQALTGGLTAWLDRRTRPRTAADASDVSPQTASQPVPQQPVQFFDAQTGQPVAPDPSLVAADTVLTQQAAVPLPVEQPFPDASQPLPVTQDPTYVASATVDLFAGLAYEVHALSADGQTIPVNPATHEFRTGDQFVVLLRPTLPGRIEVYNVNAAGQQTQIDLQVIAAGQLTRLGPYQFAALTGDEQLKLVLVPCSTPALTAATRDIVNVAGPVVESGAGLDLVTCQPAVRSLNRVRTRDIRTRDILKVAVEGQTGFALDAVTAQERATGNLAPREVTIVMRHR